MIPSFAPLLLILAVMVVVLVAEWFSSEVVAFVVLLLLFYLDYLRPAEAFEGFSSPVVITIFAIFFISGALRETGVADAFGRRIAVWSGGNETRLLIGLMLVSALFSAFINNVAAVAMLMPAVSSITAHTEVPPSKLFMPLAFGVILGGATTLVGTPPNLVASQVLVQYGFQPLSLFDFAPLGLVILLLGVAYMVFFGQHWLPGGTSARRRRDSSRLTRAYRIEERLTSIKVPAGSHLDGATLRETRLGNALDVTVVAVLRGRKKILAPGPDFRLESDDALLVDGAFADLEHLLNVQGLAVFETDPGKMRLAHKAQGMVLSLPSGSGLVGKSLRELRFRDRFGVLVVGLRRGRDLVREELGRRILRPTDRILALGTAEQVAALRDQSGLRLEAEGLALSELIEERFFTLKVPPGSPLLGRSVRESRLGELAGLTVLGIFRGGELMLAVAGDEKIEKGDELLVAGEPTRILDLVQLGQIEIEAEPTAGQLESDTVTVAEVVVAPRSAAAGSSLRQISFRDRYGLQALALWRGGAAIAKEIANMPLRYGDAILVHGPAEKVRRLMDDPDFVVLLAPDESRRRKTKAPWAIGALLLLIVLIITKAAPTHIAALTAAMVCVVSGAITMPEAYRTIEWKALYFLAAVWPMGTAMQKSGASNWLADQIVGLGENASPIVFLAVLIVASSLLSQVLDGVPAVIILGSVAIEVASQLGVSPYPLMVGIGLAASAAFMTPWSHKASLLVVNAGGYSTRDFLRVGTPLTLLMMVLLVLLVPLAFPF